MSAVAIAVLVLCSCAVFAGGLVVAFKLDAVRRSIEATGDHYFSMQRAFGGMERAGNELAGKVDHVAAHFSYPPVTDPVPLPSIDDETAAEPRRKRSKRPR